MMNDATRRVKFSDENDHTYVNSVLFDDETKMGPSPINHAVRKNVGMSHMNSPMISFTSPSPAKTILRSTTPGSGVNGTQRSGGPPLNSLFSNSKPNSNSNSNMNTASTSSIGGQSKQKHILFNSPSQPQHSNSPPNSGVSPNNGDGYFHQQGGYASAGRSRNIGRNTIFSEAETSRSLTDDAPGTGINRTAAGYTPGINKTAAGYTPGINKTAAGYTPGINKTAAGYTPGIKGSCGPPIQSLLSQTPTSIPRHSNGFGTNDRIAETNTNTPTAGGYSPSREPDRVSGTTGMGLYCNISVGGTASATTTPLATPNVTPQHKEQSTSKPHNLSASPDLETTVKQWVCISMTHLGHCPLDEFRALFQMKYSKYGEITELCIAKNDSEWVFIRFSTVLEAAEAASNENGCTIELNGDSYRMCVIQLTVTKASSMGIGFEPDATGSESDFLSYRPILLNARNVDELDRNTENTPLLGLRSRNTRAAATESDISTPHRQVLEFDKVEDIMLVQHEHSQKKQRSSSSGKDESKVLTTKKKRKSICTQIFEYFFAY